jgi:hypothetical protein
LYHSTLAFLFTDTNKLLATISDDKNETLTAAEQCYLTPDNGTRQFARRAVRPMVADDFGHNLIARINQVQQERFRS